MFQLIWSKIKSKKKLVFWFEIKIKKSWFMFITFISKLVLDLMLWMLQIMIAEILDTDFFVYFMRWLYEISLDLKVVLISKLKSHVNNALNLRSEI